MKSKPFWTPNIKELFTDKFKSNLHFFQSNLNDSIKATPLNISDWGSITVDNLEFPLSFVVDAVMFELGYFTLSSIEVSLFFLYFYLLNL
jgi:hypothetical protein